MKHIRIISPASAIDAQWIDRAKVRLEQWGFLVSVGTHAYGNNGRFAASDEARAADLNEALADARTALDISVFPYAKYRLVSNEQPDPKMIWCYDGPYFGYLVQETAPEQED